MVKSRDIWHPDLARHCRVIPYPIRQKPGNRHIIKGFPGSGVRASCLWASRMGKSAAKHAFEHGLALGSMPGVNAPGSMPRAQAAVIAGRRYQSSTTEVATGSTSLVAPPWAASPDLPGFGFDSVAGRPVWLIWLTAPSGTWRHVNQQSVFSLGNQHAQDEDQEKRRKALSGSRQRIHQAWSGVQASHPDQEDHQNKRQLRGSAAVHETNVASVKAMMPFA